MLPRSFCDAFFLRFYRCTFRSLMLHQARTCLVARSLLPEIFFSSSFEAHAFASAPPPAFIILHTMPLCTPPGKRRLRPLFPFSPCALQRSRPISAAATNWHSPNHPPMSQTGKKQKGKESKEESAPIQHRYSQTAVSFGLFLGRS